MDTIQGIVKKSTGSWYQVFDSEGTIYDCRIKGKLRIKGIKSTNPVTVGDSVNFILQDEKSEAGNPLGIIASLNPRKNYIIRKSINLSKQYHIIAANIDRAFLVVTVNYPQTTTTFIDRFLASAEAYRIPVTIVFNKVDRYNDDEMETLNEWYGIYHKIGYTCIGTSAKTGQSLDELQALMKDKTTVFAGHSGVGKSTLVNSVDENLTLRTDDISDYNNSGRHTTTFSEMFDLKFGGQIIDTPGIKGFGMIDMEKNDVSHFFTEIFQTSESCKFNNCTHTHEPGCSVREAVEEGEIALSRYESYLNILSDDDEKHYREKF